MHCNYLGSYVLTFKCNVCRIRGLTGVSWFQRVHILYCNMYRLVQRDTVSHGNALIWTLVLLVWKAFTSTRNQMYVSDTSRNALQSCLVFHSILDLLLKTSLSANCYSFFDIILSYLPKNSIQRNMKRRGEKHLGTGRKKSPSITKITREWITLQSK